MMDATASWSVRCEIEGQTLAPTVAYETALTEICGAHVVSVSRPYLDAPTWIIEGFFDAAPDAGLVRQALTLASESGDAPSYDIIDHGVRDWLAENRASFLPCILDGFGFMGRISPTQRLRGRRNYMLRPQKHLALAHTPQQKGACVPWMMFWPSALHAVS